MLPNARVFVAFAVATLAASFGSPVAAAASGDNSVRPHRHHRAHHAIHRAVVGERLPNGPEYGFLTHVPPNAIRMPGYTFVPGVGILGASCDLPTSACSNEYRDIR